MSIQLYQVDAFTDRPFGGNPAAVCLLSDPCADDWMQAVAAEMNLSETAFIWPVETGYSLKWFTPRVEVDLCGHATLAAAHVIWTENIAPHEQAIRFETRSGALTARQSSDMIELDFPATPPVTSAEFDPWQEILGSEPEFVGRSKFDAFLVFNSEDIVRSIEPDFRKLAAVAARGVIVTSRSSAPEFDFVSRFFAPSSGVDEDPVTGSAHCALAPYWSEILGKHSMTAYQASRRGGTVQVSLKGDRVILGGQAVTVLRGALEC